MYWSYRIFAWIVKLVPVIQDFNSSEFDTSRFDCTCTIFPDAKSNWNNKRSLHAIQQLFCQMKSYQDSFSPATIPLLNSLPQHLVDADSLHTFKGGISKLQKLRKARLLYMDCLDLWVDGLALVLYRSLVLKVYW